MKIYKKRTVIFDVDSTPVFNKLVIEGTLIFVSEADPEHLRKLNTRSLVVKEGGSLQIGTESTPYTSRLVITLHSRYFDDPEDTTNYSILCGGKVFCVYNGALEIHGRPNTPTWSSLKRTVGKYSF